MTDKPVKRVISIPQGAKVGPDARPMYGYKDVPADCLGGLCVHKTGKGARWKWMVTHEASGLSLERIGAMTKARALENMRAALDLDIDWTLPERKVLDALRQSRGIVDAITRIGESN